MIEFTFTCFFAIQSVLSINMKLPIRKLTNHLLVILSTFLTVWQLKKQICKNIQNTQDSTFADIYFSDFSSFIFKVPVDKIVIDEEELHSIEINSILNLENPSRTVFIDSECWNLKVVVDVGELTRSITK